MLLHLIFGPPAAGEATRGYLHGGLLIDFVGQKSPVARWKVMVLDLLVLALQVLVFGVTVERRAIRSQGESPANVEEVANEQTQDYDSEERGMLRQDSSTVEVFEMQDFQHTSWRTSSSVDRGRDELLQHPSSSESRNHHPLESYYTGQQVIANLHLIDLVRTQWQARGIGSVGADASASNVQAAVVAAAAGRTLTYRLNQQVQDSE